MKTITSGAARDDGVFSHSIALSATGTLPIANEDAPANWRAEVLSLLTDIRDALQPEVKYYR